MTKFFTIAVCIMLSLSCIAVPSTSAATRLSTSNKTALSSCLQQEYLMRDTYKGIAAKYPSLTAFSTIASQEASMIGTLANLFAKFNIGVPRDTQTSAAAALVASATSASNADAVAISLEQSVASLMTQLLPAVTDTTVASAMALIQSTCLGSHVAAFTAEHATVVIPAPVVPPSAPTTPVQHVVSFTTADSSSTFKTLLADETIDVLEMASGTYHLPYMVININRTRPILVRPAVGATVVFSGASIGSDPQFQFGDGGMAGNITMQGFTFDGYLLGQQGIIQARETHDITLNNMTVRNSKANGTTGQPITAWALYLSCNATTHDTNFVANDWIVDCSNRQMGALQVYGGNSVTATGWTVSNAYYAVYASDARGPLSGLVLDRWTISGSGAPAWGSSNVSVAVENSSGTYRNLHASTSGILLNVGSPRLTDGGGNSL